MRERLSHRMRPSALGAVTATMYLIGGLGLTASVIAYTPGKNPRWALAALALVALGFAATALGRRKSFTQLEASLMLAFAMVTIPVMTHTSGLDVMAFGNGVGLPLIGIYTSLMLPRRTVILFYLGLWGWVASVIGRGDSGFDSIALIVGVEGTLATEIVRMLVWRLQRLANTDPLTGVLNRHGLELESRRLLENAARKDTPLSVALIDLDDLRSVNNTLGHRAGDDLIVAASRQWRDAVARPGVVARIGGDEFVILMPGTAEDEALTRVDELAGSASVRWTAGVAQLRSGETLLQVIERADEAMYSHKTVDVPRPRRVP